MRTTLLFIPITFCFLFSANAQLKWGANAGLNISSVTNIKVFNPEPLFTFQFSGMAMIPFGKSLGVKPSLGYRGKGYAFHERLYADSPSVRTKWRYDYLQLSAPVVLRCNKNDNHRLYAGAGLYVSYLLGVNLNGSSVPTDRFRQLDLGLNFSIALTLGQSWIIEVASDLGPGAETYGNLSNISSGVSLGYFFN
jgi:outer membrane protein with beta-barrel domain